MSEVNCYAVEDHHGLKLALHVGPDNKTTPLKLDYLAEGAANVVFRIIVNRTSSSAPLTSKVLRVRKDKASTLGAAEQQAWRDTTIDPMFPARLRLQETLVPIDASVVSALNATLRNLESSGVRPTSRHGDVLSATDNHALLLQDMSPDPDRLTLELKPKWLVQSPDAPPGAKRCRTCALRAMRTRNESLDGGGGAAFCPLALASEDFEVRSRALGVVLDRAGVGESWQGIERESLLDLLDEKLGAVTRPLATYQSVFDPGGILSFRGEEDVGTRLALAMTLRDCTVFVRFGSANSSAINGDSGGEDVEVKVADLDAKVLSDERLSKWRKTEMGLVNGRWYLNTEEGATPETVCVLSTS